MDNATEYLKYAILIGLGATAATDLWAAARKRFGGIAGPDYGLVGRWLAHMTRGTFRHDRIAAAPMIRGERAIGWIAHYAIGIAFASILLAIFGLDWARHPTIFPALVVGIGSVAAPFLLMQPGMGAGIAASRTPDPSAARTRSLLTHTIFGLGLYVAAWLTSVLAS
ncbi:MAG TPA: DUF2938 domain-containing protein [Rhodanobacteraceae bacterium]|nr:DUF2938 domain-containing protein [Rhodanobacteraceae bacterium]